MTKYQLKQAVDTALGMESEQRGDDLIYKSPTGFEILTVATYYDELKRTHRVQAISHGDSRLQEMLFNLHRGQVR